MTTTDIREYCDSGLLKIELSRPSVRNALLPHMLDAMAVVFDRAIADDTVRVVVLSGEGKSFCAGGDAGSRPEDFPIAWKGLTRLLTTMERCPKPIVARVQGHAIGFGCSLALAADFVVAETTTRFSWPFVQMGLVPEGARVAARIMPPAMLRSFAILGLSLTGSDLAAARVIHEAVAPEKLDAKIRELTEQLQSLPNFGIAAVKQSLQIATQTSLEESLRWEGGRQSEIRASPSYLSFRAEYFRRIGIDSGR